MGNGKREDVDQGRRKVKGKEVSESWEEATEIWKGQLSQLSQLFISNQYKPHAVELKSKEITSEEKELVHVTYICKFVLILKDMF